MVSSDGAPQTEGFKKRRRAELLDAARREYRYYDRCPNQHTGANLRRLMLDGDIDPEQLDLPRSTT